MKPYVRVVLFYVVCFLGTHFLSVQILDPAIHQLYAEALFFCIIALTTLLCIHFDKKRMALFNVKQLQNHIVYGCKIGFFWTLTAFFLLYVSTTVVFHQIAWNPMLPIWILACWLHVFAEELLIRGYPFQLMKQTHPIVALFVSILVFLILCAQTDGLSIINLSLISLFLSLVSIQEKSLAPAITIHFIWDVVFGIFFNGIPFDPYPQIIELTFQGNQLLSGGPFHMQASGITTLLNMLLMSYFLLVKKPNIK